MLKRFISFVLILSGCSSNLPTTDKLDRLGYVNGQALYYAQRLNLNTTVQVYATLGKQFNFNGWTDNAAGVACPQEKGPFIIAFSQACIEDENICSSDYLNKLVAHETCHIYYNEQFSPCNHNEDRATECSNRLVAGLLP